MIVLNFDRCYYHWALLLLRSLQLHDRGHRVLCDAVGLAPEQVDTLSLAHPRVLCRNAPAAVLGGITPAAMANRKPFVLRDAIANYADEPWFCLLDADMLVRRRLDDLWQSAENSPAALMFSNGMWEGQFYPRLVTISSVVLVRPDGHELIDRWAYWFHHDRPVDGIRPRGWFWDQITLFLAWTETGQFIAPIPLNLFANDRLDPNAAIWAANVPDKESYFRYFQAEHQRQRTLCGESAELFQ